MERKVSEPAVSYSTDTTDEDARKLAALHYDVPTARIEVERDGGCVHAWLVGEPEPEQGRLL